MTNTHEEARRLLSAGLKLVELLPKSKQPKELGWQLRALDHPSQVHDAAGGYGLLLAASGLCSLDFDNNPVAESGLRACGFDPQAIRAAGIPTSSTRPGSGGRVTFRVPAGAQLRRLVFRSPAGGTILELRATAPNLQDCLPGTTYTSKDGSGPWVQDYAGPFTFDMAPDLPADLLQWWQRMSDDLDYLHTQQRLIAGPAAALDVSSGRTLDFQSPCRAEFNRTHSVAEILTEHGYTENRGRFAPPTATGTHGVRPIPGCDDLWQSDHASDLLFGTFDAWIAFVVLKHGRDLQAAETEAEQARTAVAVEGFEEVDQCADLLEDLRGMDADRVAAVWAERAADLTETEGRRVIEAVHNRTGAGLRVLGVQLKEARQQAAARRVFDRAGNRQTIMHRPAESADQARQLAGLIRARDPLALVRHAGRPVRVAPARPLHAHGIASDDAPEQVLVSEHSRATLVAAAEGVALFVQATKNGRRAIAIPAPVVDQLLACEPGIAPEIAGLVGWPLVLRSGELLARDGLHDATGLVLHGLPDATELRPYGKTEAGEALAWLREHYLAGFEFASALDADAAIAGLFTAVQRPVLDMAPALAILAAAQSSGKTTLARRQHLVLTGRDAPLSNLPLGNDEELQKHLLALLLTSPAQLTFDNVPDGMVLALGPLNAVLTAPVMEGRVLGATRTVRASTATAVVITGNNLRLGADETSRTLIARLAPAAVRPEARQFAHADIAAHALGIRAQALTHVVGIVAGFLQAAAPGPTRSRFALWDLFVRQSLMWAGASDVAGVFDRNAENAEHLAALRTVLRCLGSEFGGDPFTARDVINRLVISGADLTDALDSLHCRNPMVPKSLGRCLVAQVGRPVEIDGQAVKLTSAPNRDGVTLFRVGGHQCGV